MRRMALNVLRHHGSARDSIRRRKLRATLNNDYRLRSSVRPVQLPHSAIALQYQQRFSILAISLALLHKSLTD